jgi:hypothetical protein
MSLPRLHSYTWSDIDEEGAAPSATRQPAHDDPLGLVDRELHLWITYPDSKKSKARRKRKGGKRRQSKRKLWAVIIVEAVTRQDDFTYEVTLKRIYKKGERLIKIWVRNDPADQSEDAAVFGILSPRVACLDPLEQQLSMWTAKRVYDAIAETWAGVHT